MSIGARYALSGRLDDYTGDPIQVMAFALLGALREYAGRGGDLENMQLTVTAQAITPGRTSRKVTTVLVDGYEKEKEGGDVVAPRS